jgi:hypothetical protein
MGKAWDNQVANPFRQRSHVGFQKPDGELFVDLALRNEDKAKKQKSSLVGKAKEASKVLREQKGNVVTTTVVGQNSSASYKTSGVSGLNTVVVAGKGELFSITGDKEVDQVQIELAQVEFNRRMRLKDTNFCLEIGPVSYCISGIESEDQQTFADFRAMILSRSKIVWLSQQKEYVPSELEKAEEEYQLAVVKNKTKAVEVSIANGDAQVTKAEQTSNTIVCVEQGKCDVVNAKTGSFVAQEGDKVSYYENKTNMRNATGDLKSGIVPLAQNVDINKATDKASKLATEQVETLISEENAKQKANRKYGPPKPEEKPADVEWNSTTEQKSTSTEVGQNVQMQQPVQYGQANNLPPILNGGTAKVSTTQPSTIYGRPVVWINGVAYWKN